MPPQVTPQTTINKTTMSKTKEEENFKELISDTPSEWKNKAQQRLDEYAKQEAIGFNLFMEINAVRNGEDEWKYKGDNFKQQYTTDQLYTIYKNQK
jgi:hypothetical protein